MKQAEHIPLNPQEMRCPKEGCGARGRIGIHSHKERRYICHACKGTFAATTGSALYGLKYPLWIVGLVLHLLAYGCPLVAIEKAFELDGRTVRLWQERGGAQAMQVQTQVLERGDLPLMQIQADELRVKRRGGVAWLATAMEVFSRFFVWGEVAETRNAPLLKRLVHQVWYGVRVAPRRLLWLTDGLSSYRTAVRQCFYTTARTGQRGRPAHVIWPELHMLQVVKAGLKRGGSLTHRLVLGSWHGVHDLLWASQLHCARPNTAFIERLNATFRERLPALVRRKRAPAQQLARLQAEMFWVGAVYNFVDPHCALDGTPAMALGLTDRPWTVQELLCWSPHSSSLLHDST